MTSRTLPAEGAPWPEWHAIADELVVPEGVHHPSPFSAILAAAPIPVAGRAVVDAGSGAGLITISALARGASAVIACDLDAFALAATRSNVERLLGREALDRLSLFQADFRQLGMLRADVLLANPPQRPAAILPAVPAEERHLHTGGGDDGLDAIRTILDHARVSEVYTTAADVLPVAQLEREGWSTPRVVATAEAPMHPAWRLVGVGDTAPVNVWAFSATALDGL